MHFGDRQAARKLNLSLLISMEKIRIHDGSSAAGHQ
jgi:hypothetical protein